jgi:undecaprenyl-diphosphatase
VSSTGHLIITSALLGLKDPKSKDAIDAFEIVIQGGAILAVLGLYFPRFVQMFKGLLGKDPAGLRLLINVGIAFMPAAVVGLALNKVIKEHLFTPAPVVLALIVGGVYMIAIEQWRRGRFSRPRFHTREHGIEDMTPVQALIIGCLQIVSMWPGTSRSMMTITGGYLTGLRPTAAAEFSFLLGMPTLLAATGYTLYKDVKHAAAAGTKNFYQELGITPVLIGIVVSAVAAAVAVRWLVKFLNTHGLTGFGVYRIVIGIALAGLIVGGIVNINGQGKGGGATAKPMLSPAQGGGR